MGGLTTRMVSDFQSETVFMVNEHSTLTGVKLTSHSSIKSQSELELKRKMALNLKKNGNFQSGLGGGLSPKMVPDSKF